MGGALADKIGGVKALMAVFVVAALALAGVPQADTLPAALGLFVVAMLALGTGNGSVFQLVPQRFSAEIGVMTGLVGMAGGVGGFYLASSLGFAKRSEEHTSELQSLMRNSYAVFCLKKKKQ